MDDSSDSCRLVPIRNDEQLNEAKRSELHRPAVLAMNDFQYMSRTTGLANNGDQRKAFLSVYEMREAQACERVAYLISGEHSYQCIHSSKQQ